MLHCSCGARQDALPNAVRAWAVAELLLGVCCVVLCVGSSECVARSCSTLPEIVAHCSQSMGSLGIGRHGLFDMVLTCFRSKGALPDIAMNC